MDGLGVGPISVLLRKHTGPTSFEVTVPVGGADAVLHTTVSMGVHVAKCTSVTIVRYEIRWIETCLHIYADSVDEPGILLHPTVARGAFRVAELFGGIGGWTYASIAAGVHPAVIIDVDETVCHACAKGLNVPVFNPGEFLTYAMGNKHQTTVVVNGSVTDVMIWVALCLLNVSILLISPPCQPWSTSGKMRGLSTDDGAAFSQTLTYAGLAHMHAVVGENVPGFAKHPDYQNVITSAAFKGLKLVCSDVITCQRALPLYRSRWLGSFIHNSIAVDAADVKTAISMCITEDISQCKLPGPSLLEADAVHVNITPGELGPLIPDDNLVQYLKRSDLVPGWLKDKIDWTKNEPVLMARIITGDMKMSGVMACYGSQQCLPIDHLIAKGLHTVVYGDATGFRLFSPWEVLASLGFPSSVVLSSDLAEAFKQVGNSLSPVQALVQIAKTHRVLGHLSPFHFNESLDVMVHKLVKNAIKLSQCVTQVSGDFWTLIAAPQKDETEQVPVAKRPRVESTIPATVAFNIDQVCSTDTLGFEPEIDFAGLGVSGKPGAVVQGGLLVLKHHQRHWQTMVHGRDEDVLSTLVQRALPHAKDEHFLTFDDAGDRLQWGQVVKCFPAKTVIFTPATVVFSCNSQNGATIVMNGDVTWTVNTMKSYAACMMKCNIDGLAVQYKGLPTNDCDFLTEYEQCSFSLKFKACMPGYVAFAPPTNTGDATDLKPATPSSVRFVARHPLKKVIRSVHAIYGEDFGTVVRRLFPDLVDHMAWSLSESGVTLNVTARIEGNTHFAIQWDCFRPIAPTDVDIVCMDMPIDASALQVRHALAPQRWIKSPFKSRPVIVRACDEWSIKQVAASYLMPTQLNINVTCQVGGQVLDPNLKLSDIPMQAILNFNVAPLLGGAKSSGEQLKGRVKTCLELHGVAADVSGDRAAAFLAKADHETLLKNIGQDDEHFWQSIKDEANRVHYRLVYRNEMQTAKKAGRAKPPAKAGQKPKGPSRPKDDFVANASNIRIDVNHFRDGDDSVPLIDASRFGQDQFGIAIMTAEEANKYVSSSAISLEPLAILIIGKNFSHDDEPFDMPAYTQSGQPIIVRAALRNFGDRPVEFRPSVPKMQVGKTASTVLEFHIRRCEVSSWKECSVPLQYLGVHVSAFRGASLISTWSIRSFGENRQPAPFKDSAYWHGYVRVSDEILEQVLARSGWSGIYVTPKTPDRKLDDRFAVIMMPDCSLADLQRKASSLDKALGIVRVKDQIGIRCRRDHACALRTTLLPEAAYVATNSFDQSDELWLLKNIPSEIGHSGLSEALRQAGWEAQPIRAQGQNRWLVAAKQNPPCMHLCLNEKYVLIEPAKRPGESKGVTMVAKQFKVDTVVSTTNGVTQVATSSRFQEIKAEVSEHMENRITQANQKIEQLQHALEQMQSTQMQMAHDAQTTQVELAQVREEQAFARSKIAEVETSVVSSGQTVIQTMKQMMQTMQLNLENSMKQLVARQEEPAPKCPRVESFQSS